MTLCSRTARSPARPLPRSVRAVPCGARVPGQPIIVLVDRRRVLALLLGMGAGLLLVSAAWQSAKHAGWQPVSLFVDRVIDADSDVSVANWYSSSLFLVAGVVAGLAAARERSSRWAWSAVAAGSLTVSADEALGLHDMVGSAWAPCCCSSPQSASTCSAAI